MDFVVICFLRVLKSFGVKFEYSKFYDGPNEPFYIIDIFGLPAELDLKLIDANYLLFEGTESVADDTLKKAKHTKNIYSKNYPCVAMADSVIRITLNPSNYGYVINTVEPMMRKYFFK